MRIIEGIFHETTYPTTPEVRVMSRSALESLNIAHYPKHVGYRIAIISIVNPGNYFPKIYWKQDYHSMMLEFYDISAPITDLFGEVWYPMSDKDAEDVVYFVNQLWHRLDLLIVQCEAGISRSAGVAGAILKAKTGDDSQIFNGNKYSPNMICYRKVLNAFMNNSGEKTNAE